MKALVLAGGYPQINLINELHTIGYYVILADYYENPVAREYADKFYRISTLDISAIQKISEDECVDIILTICTDQALHTVVIVSEQLHLPCYLNYETVNNVTNKLHMKKILHDNNIPTAAYVIPDVSHCNDNGALLESISQAKLMFPMIVKPANCNSSKGVVKVYDIDNLFSSLNDAINYSRTGEALIEQFISGIELTIDAYIEDGATSILAVSVNEKIKSDDKFVNFRTFNPAPIDDDIMSRITQITKSIVTAFHLRNTPLLIQALFDGQKIYVCEFSARTGGGAKYFLLEQTTGFSPAKAVIDLTLYGVYHFEPQKRKFKYLVNEYVYCNNGIYDSLSDEWIVLKNNGTISDFFVYKTKGHEFTTLQTCGDRVAGFSIEGNSIEELNRKQELANSLLKVWDSTHTDIMRHDLFSPIDMSTLSI